MCTFYCWFVVFFFFFFFFNDTATTEIYTLSLHDALPIYVPHELFMILDHPGETEETLAETRSNLEKVLGPFTSVVGFRYIHFPQFAHRYAEYQQRFGTELQAPLFWWREPAFCARSLSDRYVPSKRDSESFDVAKERMERAIAPYESLCREYARRTPHGNVVRRDIDRKS